MCQRNQLSLSFLFILCVFTFICIEVSGELNAAESNSDMEQSDLSSLRYLAFGTSKTYGARLGKPSDDAFPYLLSSEATNLALRATGPTYPNMCAQSMVGDGMYDVIMIEYFTDAPEGAAQLAQRLRERFPDATIIFIVIWFFHMIRCIEDSEHFRMFDWIRKKGFVNQRLVVDRIKLIKAIEAKPSADFYFSPQITHHGLNTIEIAAKSVHGYILKGPPSTMDFFADDWYHPSEEGHRMMA